MVTNYCRTKPIFSINSSDHRKLVPALLPSMDSLTLLIFCSLVSVLGFVFVNCYHASYVSAVLAVIACLSICPSIMSRSCTKMARPRITLTIRQPRDSSFPMPKISVKFQQDHPKQGCQIGVGSNWAISTRKQLCGSDAVPPQLCVPPRRSTPRMCLCWRSDLGLLLSTTSGQSRLRLLCLCQLTVCISRASC